MIWFHFPFTYSADIKIKPKFHYTDFATVSNKVHCGHKSWKSATQIMSPIFMTCVADLRDLCPCADFVTDLCPRLSWFVSTTFPRESFGESRRNGIWSLLDSHLLHSRYHTRLNTLQLHKKTDKLIEVISQWCEEQNLKNKMIQLHTTEHEIKSRSRNCKADQDQQTS